MDDELRYSSRSSELPGTGRSRVHRARRALTDLVAPSLVTGIVVSVAVLLWFGYRAIDEWRNTTALLARQRSSEAADLLLTALRRDMSGVQTSVLDSQELKQFASGHPQQISNVIASAFARYPYPESFFAWEAGASLDEVVFFHRSDRRPDWAPALHEPSRFPVDVAHDARISRAIMSRVMSDAGRGRTLSAFDTELDGSQYQVVGHISYADIYREQVSAVIGFVVDLNWVSRHYFAELTSEVWQIGAGPDGGLVLSVTDGSGRVVAGSAMPDSTTLTERRSFPLMFFDPDAYRSRELSDELWTVSVSAISDASLVQASRVANQMTVVGTASAAALAAGLLLMGRAERARANLAQMRADFVAAVTHELKTPIATIQAAAETLSRDRLSSMSFKACGHIVGMETKRLSRLVENFLAYSRITDVADTYAFEPVEIGILFNDVQQAFEAQLDHRGFELEMRIDPGVPRVRGDRSALGLLFNNLVDNAMKYSGQDPKLLLSAHTDGDMVRIEVVDSGLGIPEDEISLVTRKFVRGRGAASAGTGLGLTIATRIATDHGGALRIRSTLGRGTTVTVMLPVSEHDERSPGGRALGLG